MPINVIPSTLDNIAGFEFASKKHSLTTANGQPKISPIEGVVFRSTGPVSHDKGYLTELYRNDWSITDLPIVQVNSSTTFAGQVRAWGIHASTTDRLFALTGSFCVVVFDGRESSKTFGSVNEFFIGGKSQGLVLIPPGLWHGWKNIGMEAATIISMPSNLYDYDNPDRWELPWDSEKAPQFIPYKWPE